MVDEYVAKFDPGESHLNPYNKRAAAERRWKFDERRQVYVDVGGCIVAQSAQDVRALGISCKGTTSP